MRNLPNIEKSAFQKGAYTGYGHGLVYHIKPNVKGGLWGATAIDWIVDSKGSLTIFGKTLAEISAKLSAPRD